MLPNVSAIIPPDSGADNRFQDAILTAISPDKRGDLGTIAPFDIAALKVPEYAARTQDRAGEARELGLQILRDRRSRLHVDRLLARARWASPDDLHERAQEQIDADHEARRNHGRRVEARTEHPLHDGRLPELRGSIEAADIEPHLEDDACCAETNARDHLRRHSGRACLARHQACKDHKGRRAERHQLGRSRFTPSGCHPRSPAAPKRLKQRDDGVVLRAARLGIEHVGEYHPVIRRCEHRQNLSSAHTVAKLYVEPRDSPRMRPRSSTKANNPQGRPTIGGSPMQGELGTGRRDDRPA